MADSLETEKKPCSVKARQGFSVYYRNRYLYSQYDAEKPVTRLIDSLSILPETLVLAYSPALGTGLSRLLERLPENCFVLAVEFDRELFDFFMATDTAKAALTDPRFSAVLLERPEQIAGLLSLNRKQASALSSGTALSGTQATAGHPVVLPPQGSFRRCLTVEMSGGTAFNQDAFRLTTKYADDSIATFWKNHITLTRLGRLYAKNLLSNSALIGTKPEDGKPHAVPLIPASVTKPVLALGAGPSLDELLPQLAPVRESFFILAADAALPALAQHGLRPDAVVAVESQLAIEKAYIGFEGSRIPLIADMTSRPRVLSIMKGPVSLFMTRYCNEPFMDRFESLARANGIPVFQPLGSVGLYALELALYLRSEDTPVFYSGLDFAWGKGCTHCKGAPAHTNVLMNTSRLNPVGNPASAFGAGTNAFTGKSGATEYTTPNLSGYGRLLAERYKNTPLLFDAGSTGMETGIARISIENMLSEAQKRAVNASSDESGKITLWQKDPPVNAPVSASAFLEAEYAAIKEICKLIDENEAGAFLKPGEYAARGGLSETDRARLLSLLEEHSWLFLHFPDAARGPSLHRDFLIRVEMEGERLLTQSSRLLK